MKAWKLPMLNGLSQDQEGWMDTAGWCPLPTRISATTDSSSSMMISTASSTRCSRAEISMPR